MPKEYHISNVSTGWKLPLNLAILFHVLLLSSAIILPKYIHTRPTLPEFTSVDLINIADILPVPESAAIQSTPPAKVSKTPITKIQKTTAVTPKKIAPITTVAPETPQASVTEAISIKPLKRKIKNKLPKVDTSAQDRQKKRKAEQDRKLIARQQALEAESRRLEEEANRQKAIADAEAKLAASAALSALKQSLRADEVAAGTRRSHGGSSNVLEAQYFSSIFSHLHKYWAFPVSKQEDLELNAVVVIEIAQDGRIINYKFEKRSGDRVFDQFVNRAIQEANPLPAIPQALKKHQYTLGLRFKPGKIQ